MESLKRPPSRVEAYVAVTLSLVAASFFGVVAYYLWFIDQNSHPISLTIFTTFSFASIVLLYRAAFTSRRALSAREFSGVSWFFVTFGLVGGLAALFFTSNFGRGSLLATSLACLALGLAALRQRGNDA
ncbi:putative membrane protein [Pseudoxanthomonas japonensis]|nr:putative membrane protein [Pseudoxanthomonas japonensis]